MTSSLQSLLAYICDFYPHKRELSDARVTKMVYLADWKSALEHSRQITNIQWTFNNFGPYVDDVIRTASSDPNFEVKLETNVFGQPKKAIKLRDGCHYVVGTLTPETTAILDFVINTTKGLYWNDFIKLVYATYPIATQPRHTRLDLVVLAKEYNEYMEQLDDELSVM